jgi:hypothetical protein
MSGGLSTTRRIMEENKSIVSTSDVNNDVVVKKTRKPAAPTVLDLKDDEASAKLTAAQALKLKRDEARKLLWREYQKESQMVTGVFRDLEVGPGGNIKCNIKKYPWDQVESYHFIDGHTYTIPLHVARYLNEECRYPVYGHNVNPNAKEGEKVKQIVNQWNHRFAFISSEVLTRQINPNIMMVQNIE